MARGHPFRVEVLGPIRAVDPEGRDVTPSGALQRRLLALLVLHRGRVVPVDAAIDALWPGRLPVDPTGALQNHVSRLRAVLPEDAIDAVGDGYRLDPTAIDVDCERLAALTADPAALGDEALAEIDRILVRWHGPAFPELADVDDGRVEAARLGELRLRASLVRAEQRLARGQVDGVVAELIELADAEPLSERPRALLMEALAAAGRTAEALRVYDDFRRLLGDQLGIDPSPAIRARHAKLLQADRGEASRPAATTPPAPLPVPATPLIGRDELSAEIAGLVECCRLVTLVGPGGVGKTRVLVDVGHRLAAPRRSVVLCELAGADAGSLESVVAASLGVDRRPDIAVADQLATVLGDTDVILLIDNCEHVIDQIAALVERLLARSPGLRVVATSRERLRVPGEHVRVVPALAMYGDDAPAVRLFMERARAAVAGFAPGGAELETIAEVVRRLDGLPLAIELAAARLFTHDLAEVAAGLDRRFALLSTGRRTSKRHASLAAAVSWSFDALDAHLQAVFTGVSVFVGPFTAQQAGAVCAVALDDVATALDELCERSLVTRTADRRYVLLETLRAFGCEQVAAEGRAEAVGSRHAGHFVAWAEDADRRLWRSDQTPITELDAALPELNAALGWLLDHDDLERAGRLVASLLDYGLWRLRPDVLAWAERLAGRDAHDASPLAPQVLTATAYAAWMAGDVGETGVRSARAVAAAERHGCGMGEAATIMGNYELFEGRLDGARAWYRRAIDAAAAAGDEAQCAIASAAELLAMGYASDPATSELADRLLSEVGGAVTPYAAHAWYCAGEADLGVDPERARVRLARAVELAERTGGALVIGLAGASKASVEARVGDPERAADDFRRLIDHWRRAGMWSTQWTMLRSIALLLARRGLEREAAVLLGAIGATEAGHRVFGPDAVALDELGQRLRDSLGRAAYDAALAEGARLDGDAAVEHALRVL